MASMAIWHRTAFESTSASITSYNRKRQERKKGERESHCGVRDWFVKSVSPQRCTSLCLNSRYLPRVFSFTVKRILFISSFPRFVCFCLALLREVISPFCPPLPRQSSHAGNHSPIKKKLHQKTSFFP